MSSELPRKPVVAYYPGDKSIESGALPLVWLWDEYPLAPGSWGNIQAFYDGADSRPLIRKWIDRSTAAANPLPIYRPADAPWPAPNNDRNVRQCYAPTAEDIERVRRLFPDHPRPEAPPWDEVATRLILAGHTQPDPAGIRAPALLALLEYREATPPPGHSQGEGEAGSSAQGTEAVYMGRLLSLCTNGVFDKYLHKGVEILRDPSLSSNEKLKRLSSLKMIPPDASARTLAEALDVKAGTVKKTEYWGEHMENRRSKEAEDINARQLQLRKRDQEWERNKR